MLEGVRYKKGAEEMEGTDTWKSEEVAEGSDKERDR